ncbi:MULTISPECIES: DUF6119 family protein [unclassified Janthinobacterium]|uniref:DUF6119 family protein n=1 Tax=unclassified Janthinobacterium TaxID=2610881 RepID=UPI001613A0CC|nr:MULTISPECIES: DUF6119 family protein [unclassified Janthinobacterium]MBB5606562.1 uncharacterized protein (TIGR04141 family) [Janthinobacterium sp. S3T4]MBB5611567.1 uncharacterized protein (TIGR04141 family) [Janthinobacterium sp. S3M3]
MNIDKITVFKIKSDAENFSDFIKPLDLKKLNIPSDFEFNGEVNVVMAFKENLGKKKDQNNIPWIVFINDGLADEDKISFSSKNNFPAAIVGVEFISNGSSKFYAVTFGLGSEGLVESDYIVRDFGLRVGMNICDPDGLNRIQTSKHESVSTQSERQISAGSNFSVFNIDDEKEFMKTLAGAAHSDFNFIHSFVARDSISIKSNKDELMKWSNIVDRIYKLGAAHDLRKFENIFPGYAKFHFENDPKVIDELDKKLFDLLRSKDFSTVHAAPPEIIDFSACTFSYGASTEVFDDISLPDILGSRRSFSDRSSIQSLKNLKVIVRDTENGNFLRKWTAYKCIVADIEYDGAHYILSNAQWKKISNDLKGEVDDYIDKIVINKSDYLLSGIGIFDPETGKNKESVFNSAVAKINSDIVLFDTAKIEVANKKIYEICDFFHSNREFVQVKRLHSGSASISHLFVQGRFYSEAFFWDEACRLGMRDHVVKVVDPLHHDKFLSLMPVLRSEISPNNYKVIFCILTEDKEFSVLKLPFMARYELMYTHRYLNNSMGMSCEIAFRNVLLDVA